MVDSKPDVINKQEKHDWTFFAFFAIALILIASAIVWASARAGMFNAANADDDTPARIELPPIPVPDSSSGETSKEPAKSPDQTDASADSTDEPSEHTDGH